MRTESSYKEVVGTQDPSACVRVWGILCTEVSLECNYWCQWKNATSDNQCSKLHWWQDVNRGGWKLAISDTHRIANCASDDVTIWVAIEADNECLRNGTLARSEWNSLNGYYQESSRWPIMAFMMGRVARGDFKGTAQMFHLRTQWAI